MKKGNSRVAVPLLRIRDDILIAFNVFFELRRGQVNE